MNKYYEPEIGQAVFGCPYGAYDCPEYIEALLRHLGDEIERVEWNKHQANYEAPTKNVGGEYETDVFQMKSYYWGDCTCGFDGYEFEEKHLDTCYQNELEIEKQRAGAKLNKWDFYEFPDGWSWDKKRKVEDGIYKRLTDRYSLPMQGCAVHCTCDYEQRFEIWLGKIIYPEGHKPDCRLVLPNFKCGDFEVRWYKYLGRGMSINKQISEGDAVKIFNKCIESVRKRDVTYETL